MKYSPDEHDGRAPESETPEVDAVIYNIFSLARVARSLERRLSLAQTEIKEHMRIEDELRAENVKLSAKRSDEMLERGSLHMTQMQEQLTEAQSRIAELEKKVFTARSRVAFLVGYAQEGKLPTVLEHASALDAALKSRA